MAGKDDSQEDTEMKIEKRSRQELVVVRMVLALAGITCIIISMVTDQVTPYLAMGLGFTAVANMINCRYLLKKKGSDNGSAEDRNIS